MISVALDTSCMTGGVAILDGTSLVAEYMLSVKRTHSERLMSSLAMVMQDARLEPSDIGLISCAVGPGSFTGIRIGVASAKAMAMALRVKVAPVTGLEALCYGLPEGDLAYAMIDAKHGFSYAAKYLCTGKAPKLLGEPSVMSAEEVGTAIAEGGIKCHVRGDGAIANVEALRKLAGGLLIVPSGEDATIRPSKVGMCGITKMEAGCLVDAARLSPYYIKRSEAEVKCGGKC